MSENLYDVLDGQAYELQQRLSAEIDPPNDRRVLSASLGRYLAMTEAKGREPFEAALRPQRELNQRVRNLFASPDVPGLTTNYSGDDLKDYRQRTAAITHFANATGKDPVYLALRWPNVRAEYSLANLGKPDASDGEVFNHIAAGYSLDEQIAATGAKAGTLGKPSLKAWQEHAETFKGSPAWSEAQRDGYRQRFTEAADRVSSRLAPYRETINSTVSDLKRIMGTETGDTAADWSDLANRLLDVPKKDRAHVIKAITEIGQAADPNAAKGFGDDATAKAMGLETARAASAVAQKLGEAVYRGAVPFVTGLPDAMARASILSMRQNLDSVQVPVGFTGDVARYALAESMRPMMQAFTGGNTQAGAAAHAIGAIMEDRRSLTPEEKSATRAAIDRAIEADEMAQQIKDIADQKIDPIKSDALVMRGIYGAARSVPMTAGALVPGGGLFIAGQFANDNYHQILRENSDMPRETAQGIAVLSAPLQAVTEVISDRFLVGRLPNFARVVKAPVTTWATAARRAGGFAAAGVVTETGEEIAQDLTPYAVQAVVGALGADVPQVPWGTIVANMDANKWELIASIVPLVLVGAGGGQLADLGQGRALAARPELLEASGYSAKDSAAIATAAQEGDWNTAQNLMRASYEAGGVEFDGAKLETQRTTAVEAIKAETSEAGQMQATLQRADLVPSFERDGSGWKARYQDGSEIQVGSAAEAMDLARAHMNETEFAVAESTGRMADFLAGQQRAGEAAPVVTHSPFEALLLKSDVETGVVSRENALEASRVRIAQMDAAETADVEKTIAAGMAEGLTKEDATLEAFGILGSNKVERADNLRQLAIRIGQGSDVTTPVQEFAEGRWQAGLASGRYSMEQGVSWVRTAERVTGQKFLHLAPGETIAADGRISPAALTEAISQIVVFDTIGRRKDGSKAPAGLVTRGLKASLKRMAEIEAARATGDAKQLSLFAHFLRSFRAMFGRAFAAASALRRARESGALGEDFDSFLDDLLGADPQSRFERETAREAEALIAEADPEYVPPSAEDEAAGMAFSLAANRGPSKNITSSEDAAFINDAVSEWMARQAESDAAAARLVNSRREWRAALKAAEPFYNAPYSAERTAILEAVDSARSAMDADDAAIDRGRDSVHGVYVRLGLVPDGGKSRNGYTKRMERGVSAYRVTWDNDAGRWQITDDGSGGATQDSILEDANRHILLVTGTEIDEGSDGEPVLANVRVLKSLNPEEIIPANYDAEEWDAQHGKGWRYSYSLASLVAKRHPELEAKHNAGTITPEETAEAQRIVDAAAKGAGMKELWTGRRSAPSDPLKLVGSIWERPTWFTNERRVAVRYARGSYNPMPTPRKWVKRFMVDLKNPFTYEKSKEVWEYLDSHLPEEAPFTPEEESSDENAADSGVIRDALQRLGFDGVHYTGDDMTGEGDAHESYLVFSPSQIKSADPFTGVPLEERFPQSENIRYSLAPRALLDKLQGDIERRMAKRPELLGDYMKIARGKFVKMRADVETYRVTTSEEGEKSLHYFVNEGFDSLSSRTRTMADLEIERRARQKAREAELVEQGMNGLSRETLDAFHSDAALGDARTHPVIAQLIVADAKQIGGFRGRLRHPSQAAANMADQYDDMPEGLPRWMFGGTLDPDQAASDLGFEYTGDLWKAIGEAFNSARTFKESFLNAREAVRTVEKSAKDTAKTESLAWMDEARANVPSRKERMINALRTLHAIASGFPAEVRGRMGSVVRLASLETDEARLAEITRKLDMLEKAAERYLKKFFLGKIEDLFEKAKKPLGDAGDKMKGKLGPDGHRLFKVAEAASNATAEEADRMLASIENHLADPLITAEEEALAMRERELVSLLADLSHADASRAESAFKALHDIYFTGLAAWKAKLIAIRERREKSREEKKAATGKEGTRNERKTAEIAAAKPAGWTLRQMLDYSSFHQVANYVFGEKDALDLVDSERQASNAYDDGISAIEEDTAEFFTKLAGGNLAGQKLRYRLATVHSINGGQAGQMTPMEAIQALLMWRQEDGQRHMDGPKDEDGKPSGSWHYDQAWIDSIDSQLKPEARAVMSFIADRYSREHAPLNALYRERHGVDLPSHQYYAPLTVKPMQAKAGEVVDPVSGFSTSGNSITPGSLRTRSRRAVAEPDFKDALAVFLGHSRQIEYWKAYYDFSMEANAVLGNVEVANAVEAKAGKEALTVIRKFLDVFAMGGVRDSGAGLANHNTLSRAVSRASSAAILGRVSTLLVQTTQLAAASVKMPLGSYALRFGKLLTGQLAWSDAINSPFIQRRVRMQEPIAREAMKALGEASRPNAIKHHARKLGALLGGTDGLFTAGTYAILLDYHRGQGARLGMSGADLDAYAHQEAERATEEVAQPMRAGTKSIAELTNTSPLSRSLWAFASESRQKMMLLAWAGHAIKGGNTAQAAQFAKVAFLVFGVGGLYVQILKNLWREAKGDDEEDKWSAWNMGRAVLTAPATGVAGFSAVVEASGGLLSSFGRAVPAIEALWDDDEDTSEATMRHVETLLMSASLFSETAAGLASFMHLAVDALKLTNNATENTPTAPPQ